MNPALLGSILATFEESLSYSKTTSINKDSEDATSSSPSSERRRRWRSVLTNQNDSESEWRPTVQFTEKDKVIISRTYELIQDGIDYQISFSSSAIHHFLSIVSPSHETSMKTILLFQLLHSPKTNLTVPTISTYHHLFQSILSYKHEINDNLIETLHRQLKSHENLTFSQNTYRSLILLYHALKSDKGNQKALSLFNELKNLGITPGVGIINRIIDIHGRMYNPMAAQEVFEEAQVFNGGKSEAKPNIKTLNYLITALTDIRPPASESPPSFVSSFPIFASHSSNSKSSIGNVASTAIAHSSSSLATSSGLDLAVHYFKTFQQKYNVVPNIETYNRLISAFLLHNDTDSAITYFNEMLSRSFTPPPQIWSSILFKILAKGDYDTAKRFFLYAQENGFLFDGKLTSVFIKALMTQRGVARFYTKYVDMVIDTAGVFFVVVSVCGGVSIIGLLNT
ncbi:hypothetical protein BKA69DRAFT_1040933 [Paraphysoderma sedebokerense]|nr:hypothetical protein BKA69DRAFT_1040933 [Paraphysoderma sedebokerense]